MFGPVRTDSLYPCPPGLRVESSTTGTPWFPEDPLYHGSHTDRQLDPNDQDKSPVTSPQCTFGGQCEWILGVRQGPPGRVDVSRKVRTGWVDRGSLHLLLFRRREVRESEAAWGHSRLDQ